MHDEYLVPAELFCVHFAIQRTINSIHNSSLYTVIIRFNKNK